MLSLGKVIRSLLLLATVLIVIWSIVDVGSRVVRGWRSTDDRTTLTILHWGTPEENAIVATLVREFEQQHPHIRVVILSTNDFQTKLKTMFSAGAPPDLFYLPDISVSEYASMGLVAELDPFIEEDRQAGRRQWMDDFYPMMLRAFQYNGQVLGEGPQYGLPKDFGTMVMYVNVDLFRQAGVPVPYEGWTWEEYEDAMARITALNDSPEHSGSSIYGGVLHNATNQLRLLVWNFGGRYFADDGTNFERPTFTTQPVQEALEMIRRMRLTDHTIYRATGLGRDPGQLFMGGRVGCIGPLGRWVVPIYRGITDFEWDVVPVPHKAGIEPVSHLGLVAWAISNRTDHPEEAYQLLTFLCGPKGQAMNAELGLAIPSLQSIANSDVFLAPGQAPRHAQTYLDLVPRIRIAQHPPSEQFARIVDDEIDKAVQFGIQSPMDAAEAIEHRWLREMHSPLRNPAFPAMPWWTIGGFTIGTLGCTIALIVWRLRRTRLGVLDAWQERTGWLFISPWVIGFAAFTLGPMVVSLILSFTSWSAMTPIWEARFVGLANFQHLFQVDPTFYQSLKVTVYYVALAVPLGQAAALVIALLMARDIHGITVFRTIFFIPSIITGVALATLWLTLFNTEDGLLNTLLRPICELFGVAPPDWFGRDAGTWAVPAFVIMNLWGVGGGMIIYLAALKSVPASLYEAARIDGAGRFRQFWNVTLPMISPLVYFNLIMGIIASFQVFTQAYVMTRGGPGNATLFYVLNLYRHAFEFHNMGYASAMAWVLFVILLALTALVIRSSRSWVHYEGLKS